MQITGTSSYNSRVEMVFHCGRNGDTRSESALGLSTNRHRRLRGKRMCVSARCLLFLALIVTRAHLMYLDHCCPHVAGNTASQQHNSRTSRGSCVKPKIWSPWTLDVPCGGSSVLLPPTTWLLLGNILHLCLLCSGKSPLNCYNMIFCSPCNVNQDDAVVFLAPFACRSRRAARVLAGLPSAVPMMAGMGDLAARGWNVAMVSCVFQEECPGNA